MSDIRQWLEELGLGQYADAFEREDIDLDALRRLSDEDLKELGLTMGPRRKVLAAINELAPVAEPKDPTVPRDAERRQLTVMFCDLVGSTALSEALDPEEMREVMQDYQKACGLVIERYDGHVAQYLGDGLMVYFGWPKAHEDAAARAIQAALEIVGAVKVVGAPEPLRVRVGVATGQVVVGETGAGDASIPKLAVGETPNLAARLQGMAGEDEIVIGETTQRLAAGAFVYDDLGPQVLKGILEPVPAFRVTGTGAAEGRFEAAHGTRLTPFLGRDSEIALLSERWAQAKGGEGQVVLLEGEPGIGKSRISGTFRERIEGETHVRVVYQCSPFHTNSAFHPITQQLERAAGIASDDDNEDRLDKLEALIGADHTTELALLALLLSLPIARYPALNMSPQRQKERTIETLVAETARLAATEPLYMQFEDAHWIDPSTQEVLDQVIPAIEALPVLLVITFRPEYSPPWSYGHVSHARLNRLGKTPSAAMIDRVADGKPLPAQVKDQIVAKTDGVPLFIEELTKAVLESDLLVDTGNRYELSGNIDQLAIPATLQDSLMARLDRLIPVKEVAQIGACIGREFNYDLLAAVYPKGETQLGEALAQFEQSELVHCLGAPPNATYVFKHALVQDTAYGSLLKSRKRAIHNQIAKALSLLYPTVLDTEPELVAHHFTEAESTEAAIPCWAAAGKLAIERVAMIEAVSHLDRALELNQTLGEGAARDRQELEIRNELGVAHTALHGWASEKIYESLGPAVAIAKRLEDEEQLLPMLWGLALRDTCQANFDQARDWVDDMVANEKADPTSDLAVTGHSMGAALYFMIGNTTLARQHGEAVFAQYDAKRHEHIKNTINHDPKMFALAWESHWLWILGFPDKAARSCDHQLSLARELDHVFTLGMALTTACGAYIYRREPDVVINRTEEAFSLAQEHDLPIFEFTAREWGCWALLQAGRTQEAFEAAKHAADEWESLQGRIQVPFMRSVMARALAELGRVSDGLAAIDGALAMIEEMDERWFEAEANRLKGEMLLMQAQPTGEVAESYFMKAVKVAASQDAKSWELRAATSLAQLWGEEGERQKAYDLLFPVYDWFTEGFDTADLKDANLLLRELQ